MYTDMERSVVRKLTSAVPPAYREQREQFAQSLPWLAVLSVVFIAVLGGWLGALLSVVRLVIADRAAIGGVVLSPLFWLFLLPPFLWAASYFPLRERRLAGWRLFVVGTLLSLVGSILSLSFISILFSAAILYFSLQCYDEFYR